MEIIIPGWTYPHCNIQHTYLYTCIILYTYQILFVVLVISMFLIIYLVYIQSYIQCIIISIYIYIYINHIQSTPPTQNMELKFWFPRASPELNLKTFTQNTVDVTQNIVGPYKFFHFSTDEFIIFPQKFFTFLYKSFTFPYKFFTFPYFCHTNSFTCSVKLIIFPYIYILRNPSHVYTNSSLFHFFHMNSSLR